MRPGKASVLTSAPTPVEPKNQQPPQQQTCFPFPCYCDQSGTLLCKKSCFPSLHCNKGQQGDVTCSCACVVRDGEEYAKTMPYVPPLRPLFFLTPAMRRKFCTRSLNTNSVTASSSSSSSSSSTQKKWCYGTSSTRYPFVYIFACLVYVVYAAQILTIDFCSTLYGAEDERCSFTGETAINTQFTAAAGVHIFNALQYFLAWKIDFDYSLCNVIVIPEILNIVEASLYAVSASKYASASVSEACVEDYSCEEYMHIHYLELAACIVELLASVGWAWSWWQTYIRTPGRGFTLDDPDLIGTIFTFIPSCMYLAYNVQIYNDPLTYGSNFLYVTGDILYFVGALAYLLAVFRDIGCAAWFPLAGGWEWELVDSTGVEATKSSSSSASSSSLSLSGNGKFDSNTNSSHFTNRPGQPPLLITTIGGEGNTNVYFHHPTSNQQQQQPQQLQHYYSTGSGASSVSSSLSSLPGALSQLQQQHETQFGTPKRASMRALVHTTVPQ